MKPRLLPRPLRAHFVPEHAATVAGLYGLYDDQGDAFRAAHVFAAQSGRRHVVYRCRSHWSDHCWRVDPAAARGSWLTRRLNDRCRTGRDWPTRY